MRVLRDAWAAEWRLESFQGSGEALLEIFVEVPVQVVHTDAQEALHQLGRRPPVPIPTEQVPNDLKSPPGLDEVEHERRLQIGVDDLLWV